MKFYIQIFLTQFFLINFSLLFSSIHAAKTFSPTSKPPASAPTTTKGKHESESIWSTKLEYLDLGSDVETWTGYDFKFPSTSYLIGFNFLAGKHVHHLEVSCCEKTEETIKTRLQRGKDSTIASSTTSPNACKNHLETLIWTPSVADENQFVYPKDAGLAVGSGTMCESGFFMAHIKDSTGGLVDIVTSVNFTFTSVKPTSFVQPVSTKISSFLVKRGSGNWLVSGTFKYEPKSTEKTLGLYAVKPRTKTSGQRVRLYRLRGSDQVLIFSGDLSSSQDWFLLKDTVSIEENDSLLVECAFRRDYAEDISSCEDGSSSSTSCETCGVFWQFTTSNQVSHRIHDDFALYAPSLVSRPVTSDDSIEIGGREDRERSLMGDVVVGVFLLAFAGSIVYILIMAKRRFSTTKGYAVMGSASASSRIVSAEEEEHTADAPANGSLV